jgi:hypothetical protein
VRHTGRRTWGISGRAAGSGRGGQGVGRPSSARSASATAMAAMTRWWWWWWWRRRRLRAFVDVLYTRHRGGPGSKYTEGKMCVRGLECDCLTFASVPSNVALPAQISLSLSLSIYIYIYPLSLRPLAAVSLFSSLPQYLSTPLCFPRAICPLTPMTPHGQAAQGAENAHARTRSA